MDFLSQTYIALRGPTGAPQTAGDTIGKLSDRLSPATLLADRRAAVLSLKGLTREWKQDVGDRALPGLVDVLHNDTEIDADIAKAVLETLNMLCEVDSSSSGNKELGFKHTDYVLGNEKSTHTLFALLVDTNFYTRFATLQFLSTLLQNRRQVVQSYFLKAPGGPTNVISAIEDKREIIRNEAISMVQYLISQSPDIQKVLAFEGAFEKLFNIVSQEGGVDGGLVAQEALNCIDGLLRFNTSNQSYFRETPFPSALCSLLLFPTQLQFRDSPPQEFALQFWDQQKTANASHVIAIIGMLIGTKGGNVKESFAFIRFFVELALASNAPTPLKTQAIQLLPANLSFPLSELSITPYVPVPDTNGEEWDRLEPASALDALVELALHGEYNGSESGKRSKDSLELRAAALNVFENFVRKEEIKQAIIRSMLPPEGSDIPPPITPLLAALMTTPTSPLDLGAITATQFSALLFAHLLRGSPESKSLVLAVKPSPSPNDDQAGQGTFFVPADGAPPPETATPAKEEVVDDDDPPQTLLQILSENLSLSFLSRSRADTSEREAREWNRLVVCYLCLLSQWLWEDPKSVRQFLDAGGLGLLVEPINQTSDFDFLIPGLCTFLLGICYEFNREPGEITRATVHPILQRLGVETLIGRMARFPEDERFKSIGPDSIVQSYPHASHIVSGSKHPENSNEYEVWFDWCFADFWKSNYYTVQRGLSVDPGALSASAGSNAENAMVISSLRDVIRKQAGEIEALQKTLNQASLSNGNEVSALQNQIASLSSELHASEEKRKEFEKEQEDLLVLLDEVTNKRKHDKQRLKEAGLDVSEDEDEDGGDDEED